jgi:glycosyltransferase involved in cell wall biosynthesis
VSPPEADTHSEPESSRAAGGISVVVTVRDDRAGVEEMLAGLRAQTRAPDEVIVVDGGSRDGTLELLRDRADEGLPLRVIEAPGTNISGGRNRGIEAAENEWVACTDAGCRPVPGWLESLGRAREDGTLLTGVFTAEGHTLFQRLVGLTHYPDPGEIGAAGVLMRVSHRIFGRGFRASHAGGRSMAFTKSAWRVVGGFPEDVYAGEDQAFSLALVRHGYRPRLVPEASVAWRPPPTWRQNARMFFTYCRGDIRSPGRGRHVARLAAWALAPRAALRGGPAMRSVLLLGALGYTGLPMRRAHAAGISPRHWWRIPLLVALKDLAQLAGAGAGVLDALRGVPQPNPHDTPSAIEAAARARR